MNVGVSNLGGSGISFRMLPLQIPSCTALHFVKHEEGLLQHSLKFRRTRGRGLGIVASADVASASPSVWDDWKPAEGSSIPCLSDILWPSAGAFAAMALLGKMDQILAPKGLSMTVAPLGAVSAVLFATPSTPAARKYNMFMAQIGCAVIGVVAFTVFGPGWLARSVGLAACIAYMIWTRAIHPPAASLPLLFIDGVKLHHLNFWYALFPGAAGCILLALIDFYFFGSARGGAIPEGQPQILVSVHSKVPKHTSLLSQQDLLPRHFFQNLV